VNFSALSSRTLGGKLLRLPLRLIPDSARLPIVQGPSKGNRWIVGSGNHGCWLGSYELEQRMAFQHYVGAGDIVYDVGAHVGFYTLIASTLVGDTGRVVAFEPLPENLNFLREHLSINRIENVTVVDKAVTSHSGSEKFRRHQDRSMGSISNDGELSVSTVRLDDLIEGAHLPPPSVIKMDIEGGEYRALSGAREFLSRAHPTIILSTHGRDIHDDCCRLLRQLGFDLLSLDAGEIEESSNVLAIDGT